MESDKQNVENIYAGLIKKNPFFICNLLFNAASITVEYRFDEIIL